MLCIEKRLDWELDGVKVSFAGAAGDVCGLALGRKKFEERLGDGVVPYGCALAKL